MKNFFNKILNSEFLTFNDVLKLKVTIVSVFLFVFILLSVPLSIYFNGFEDIKIFIPLMFFSLLMISTIFLFFDRNIIAMHLTIYIVLGLTFVFTYITSSFYVYLMIFISLIVIIFYQNLFSYLFYGFLVSLYGIYYISINGEYLVGVNSINENASILLYQIILIGFYFVYFIQVMYSEKIYRDLNYEWVKMNKILERYQDYNMNFLYNIRTAVTEQLLFEDENFQNTIKQLSTFINEFISKDGDSINEVVDMYFYMHSNGLQSIIESNDYTSKMKKTALQLNKYLINVRSDLVSILINFATIFRETDSFKDNRYDYNIDVLGSDKIEKVIALATMYQYLVSEITQFDKWGNIERVFTHEEVTELFMSKEFREFITYDQLSFYLENEEFFKKYLRCK